MLAAPVFAIDLRVECLATFVAQLEPKRNADRQNPFRSDRVAANARQPDRKFLTQRVQRELNVVQTLETHKRERANGTARRQILAVLSKNGDLSR
jgi:hypothetical protein